MESLFLTRDQALSLWSGSTDSKTLDYQRTTLVKSLSHVRLFVTPWTVAYQAPPSMGFSKQEYWSGLPFPYPEDLPDPEIAPGSPRLQADALTSEPPQPWDSPGKNTGLVCHFLLQCIKVKSESVLSEIKTNTPK